MYAIVHHGGSGTTHAACKHGCPSLIIPHIVDQFFWNQRIASLGLGPQGVPINQLTKNVVQPLLMDLWQKRSYKENTVKISDEMAQEGRPDIILALL
jgi:UDP:flavonoid glycosyltransferase YjiC (YdhE family)